MKYKLQSEIFKMAHIVKKYYKINSFSESLKIVWKSFLLKKKMLQGGVYFKYITKAGYIIEAFGTLRNIEYKSKNSDKFKNDILHIRYYDLEKQDFRTFEVNKLIFVD